MNYETPVARGILEKNKFIESQLPCAVVEQFC